MEYLKGTYFLHSVKLSRKELEEISIPPMPLLQDCELLHYSHIFSKGQGLPVEFIIVIGFTQLGDILCLFINIYPVEIAVILCLDRGEVNTVAHHANNGEFLYF